MNTVILSLSDYVIGFTYSGLTSPSLERFLNVVKNVLFQDGKVELFASFAVERDAMDFTDGSDSHTFEDRPTQIQ